MGAASRSDPGCAFGDLVARPANLASIRVLVKYGFTRVRFVPALERDEFERERTMPDTKSLYERLGGYDAIAAVASDLLPRLQKDGRLARFWQHRGDDGVQREKQLLVDFLSASAGGPLYYTGRDMKTSHRGMRISEEDWTAFLGHLEATLDTFKVPRPEREQVVAFVQSTKRDIVEA